MDEFDLAEFVEAAEAAGVALSPWQREVLQQTFNGEPVRLVDVNLSHRIMRSHLRDVWAAAAIASDRTVQFVGTSREGEEAARQRALAVLDRMDRVSEDNNQ